MENDRFTVNFDYDKSKASCESKKENIKLKKNYKKSEELINFTNEKLAEIESRIGMELNGFSDLYENMSREDQEKLIELLKASEAEQHANEPRSKHQCTRKKKKKPNVKHGPRKKK